MLFQKIVPIAFEVYNTHTKVIFFLLYILKIIYFELQGKTENGLFRLVAHFSNGCGYQRSYGMPVLHMAGQAGARNSFWTPCRYSSRALKRSSYGVSASQLAMQPL